MATSVIITGRQRFVPPFNRLFEKPFAPQPLLDAIAITA
jgi:hypothetical protein